MKRDKKWIQNADLDEGALREYVQRKYGANGFTSKGTIRREILARLMRSRKVTEKTRRRVRLAKTLRRINR